MPSRWTEIVASACDGREARVRFDEAVAGLDPALRSRRPPGTPHGAGELVEHLRPAQADLLAYLEDPDDRALVWPDDTYLRTVIVALDHAAYHVGQLVLLRRLPRAWPAG